MPSSVLLHYPASLRLPHALTHDHNTAKMRTIPSTSWLHLLVVLCSLNTLLDAYDVSQEKPALGPLGVTLDYPLAIAFPDFQDPNNANVPRNWAWSSHFEFAQPVSTITDGQLWSMALDAYKEMVADAKQYGVGNRNRPGAMSVLAFGNELIFASSQKGRTSFSYTYANTPVLHSLRLCQAVVGPGEGQEHKNGGSCGEVMAVQLYYTRHPTPPLSSLGARIATIVLQNVRGGPVAPLPAVPCGDFTNGRADWGCNVFLADHAVRDLDINIPMSPYNLENLAGGVVVRDQVELC